ncbi:MAG: hypothetical protein WCH43_07805 [Verrucomicrobiota bacterium]
MTKPIEKPLFIGLKAAKANFIPGLIIQALMLAVVLAYYWHEPVRLWLNALAQWKARLGYGFTVPLSMVAGGLLPELLKVIVFQRGKIHRENFETLAFSVVFWGFMGASVDTFYRLQAEWFGTAHTVSVLTKKVLVDQFVYNVVFAAPITVWAYELKSRGYSIRGISALFTYGYYRDQIVPVLIATWGVWLPVVTIIYSLPSLLQIPLFGLALGFWVLIMTYISSHKPVI